MNIIELWNTLVPVVKAQCQAGVDRAAFSRQALDAVSNEYGCMLLVHRIGDVLPFYISPSVNGVLEGASSSLTAVGLLQFVSRQAYPLHQVWQLFKADIDNNKEGASCIAFLINDSQGKDRWLCGSYGRLGMDTNGRAMVMGLFFDLDSVGPLSIGNGNQHSTVSVLRQRLKLLTPRECEVLNLILTEHSPSQIAVKLHLSVNTVHSHRKNIMQKLEVRTQLGLTPFLPLLSVYCSGNNP